MLNAGRSGGLTPRLRGVLPNAHSMKDMDGSPPRAEKAAIAIAIAIAIAKGNTGLPRTYGEHEINTLNQRLDSGSSPPAAGIA